MRTKRLIYVKTLSMVIAFGPSLTAQVQTQVPPVVPVYMNPSLSLEQRAFDLVHRMTLAEKASQMQNNSAAIPRLNVPAYQWWSEALD